MDCWDSPPGGAASSGSRLQLLEWVISLTSTKFSQTPV